ncbi:MAG: hypothetical protein J5874_00390 [Oscillospiraceae bacterium]|nr:hypothetical protein [Oscillospiraceae bacterium]
MKSKTGKIITILLVLVFLSYAVYQIAVYFYQPYNTEIVYKAEAQDSVFCDGVFIRNEKQYDADYDGVIVYSCEEGEFISSGGEIARVYPSEEDAESISKVKKAEAQIEMLEKAKQKSANYTSLEGEINKEISETVSKIVEAVSRGKKEETEKLKTELEIALNVKASLAGNETVIDEKIEELKKTIKEAEDNVNKYVKKLKTSEKGRFVSFSDGYEQSLTIENSENYGIEDFEAILNSTVKKSNAIGKLITDYEWKYAAIIPYDAADKFVEGKKLKVDFGIEGIDVLDMTVEKIITDEQSEKAAVIFSNNYMYGEIMTRRTHSAKIIFDSISGLRIPEKALRMINGQSGVYILKKTLVRYKTIEILYRGVGYYIVKWDQNDSKSVQLFDEVFLEGKDLYEGKQIGENKI